MANEYAVNSQDLKSVADAIRTKGETTESLVFPDGFAQAIADIKAGEDVEQATPTITVDSAGLITASATQEAGLVPAGTKSATKQLTVQAAQTITPGTSNKTIASGRYLTGTQTIKGDANLVAGNIKKGVSIFGVAGELIGSNIPDFTYNGDHQIIDDGDGNWRIKLLTSGTFVLNNDITADVFVVGGGGGGYSKSGSGRRGGGGGGGYTLTQKNAVIKAGTYTITIGAGGAVATDGGSTTAFNYTANGGQGGKVYSETPSGGAGGSAGGNGASYASSSSYNGGAGGENGGDGGATTNSSTVAKGQGTSTYEFGDSSSTLYSGGGGGGGATGGAGGAGGGGTGASNASGKNATSGTTNTGGGGGGASGDSYTTLGAAGGSGIAIIRNARG